MNYSRQALVSFGCVCLAGCEIRFLPESWVLDACLIVTIFSMPVIAALVMAVRGVDFVRSFLLWLWAGLLGQDSSEGLKDKGLKLLKWIEISGASFGVMMLAMGFEAFFLSVCGAPMEPVLVGGVVFSVLLGRRPILTTLNRLFLHRRGIMVLRACLVKQLSN